MVFYCSNNIVFCSKIKKVKNPLILYNIDEEKLLKGNAAAQFFAFFIDKKSHDINKEFYKMENFISQLNPNQLVVSLYHPKLFSY